MARGEIDLLHLSDCFQDTPIFRDQLNLFDKNGQALETCIRSLLKHVKASLDVSKDLSIKNTLIAETCIEFSDCLANMSILKSRKPQEDFVHNSFRKFGEALKTIESQRQRMIEQTIAVLVEPLTTIIKTDLHEYKEVKKKFQKSADDYENAISKYMGKRPKDSSIPEAAQDVADTKSQFHRCSMNYSIFLNDLNTNKRFYFLENFMAFMYSKFAFCHLQYDLFQDLEPQMRQASLDTQESTKMFSKLTSKMEDQRITLIEECIEKYNPLTPRSAVHCSKDNPKKQGYLFKRGGQGMRQSWNRRFFCLENGQFSYLSHQGNQADDEANVKINLQLCSVRGSTEVSDRRYCFEIMSPVKCYYLQAESEIEMLEWIFALQHAIASSLHNASHSFDGDDNEIDVNFAGASSNTTSAIQAIVDERHGIQAKGTVKQMVQGLLTLPGNNICVDCGDPDPTWCSINLGILLCIECSGIHRGLGVQYSKIRSLTLDHWDIESVGVVKEIGNYLSKSFFESSVESESHKRPSASSSRPKKEEWIKAKYVTKLYIPKTDEFQDQLNEGLFKSIENGRIFDSLKYICWGAQVDCGKGEEFGKRPFHKAVEMENLLLCEFLLSWNCNINAQDDRGWTCLHFAVEKDNVKLLQFLLRRNAKSELQTKEGKTPLDMAVSAENVQIVTVLRLFKFDSDSNNINGSTEFIQRKS